MTTTTDAPRITDKQLADEITRRARSAELATHLAAMTTYRAETDALGFPAPSADGMAAALAGALLMLAERWRDDATWWDASHKRGAKSTATEGGRFDDAGM